MWINANIMIAYGLNDHKQWQLAREIAIRVVGTLAADLNTTSTWHECYSSATGHGLAAPGFLSWNTLAATLEENLLRGINPFQI